MSSNAIAGLTTQPRQRVYPAACRSAATSCGRWPAKQAIKRLSEPKARVVSSTNPKQQLLASFSARRRPESPPPTPLLSGSRKKGCNHRFRGRFYWMGLAAFARQKQVKCALTFIPDSIPSCPYPPTGPSRTADQPRTTGQKGNFWGYQTSS